MPGRGHNKGIAAEKKRRKRKEAEARNSKTPIERTRAYRRRMLTEGEYMLKGYDS